MDYFLLSHKRQPSFAEIQTFSWYQILVKAIHWVKDIRKHNAEFLQIDCLI